MEQVDLKQYIRDKFGSVSRFAALIGEDKSDFNNKIRNHIHQEGIYELAKKTEDKLIPGKEMTDETYALIRQAIYKDWRNMANFCRQNPQFSHSWVCDTINGKTGGYHKKRKNITKKVKELCEILNVKPC